jgi:hypothetical protein
LHKYSQALQFHDSNRNHILYYVNNKLGKKIMDSQKYISYQLLRWTAPLFAGTGIAITATPSLAATLASSDVSVDIFSFSHSPYSTLTSVQTNTFTKAGTIPQENSEAAFEDSEFPLLLGGNRAEAEFQAVALGENTIADVDVSVFASESLSSTDLISISASDSEGSSVAATVEASALISTLSPLASNRLSTQASGDRGANYQGIAQGKSTILGQFFLGNEPETETFSFNFNIVSTLAAFVENSQRERAKATANISFLLLGGSSEDDQTVLDFLSISSNLTKTENFYENSSSANKSNNFTLTLFDEFSNSDRNDINIFGSYQRSFNTPTYLTLVEVKQAKSLTNVPEPLTTLGAGTAALFGAVFKRKLATSKKQKK